MSKKNILVNYFSLSSLQAANYILPLITVPYIVRVIGPERYGLINFAQAFVTYFSLIVSYGFDITATREISIYRDNKEKLANIFSTTLWAKIILFIACSTVFIPMVSLIPKLEKEYLIYIYNYLVIAGAIFFPTWFFQGIEKLAKAAIFNFLIKVIFTLSIFLFVKSQSDYSLIPLISAFGQILVGIIAYFYVIKEYDLNLKSVSIGNIKSAFKDGWVVFSSTVVINLYTTSNTVILGIFANNIRVGYFTAALKLVTIIQGLILMPLNQSFFSHVGKAFNESMDYGINILRKLTLYVSVITIICSIVLFVAAPSLLKIIFGQQFVIATNCLRILSFLPVIIGLSNISAIQGLLNLKKDKAFFFITLTGAILNIGLNFMLSPKYFQEGTAVSWVVTELFITITSFIILFKNDINLINIKIGQ